MSSLKNMKLACALDKNVVTFEMTFADTYAARVYFDDVIERLESGEGVSLGLKAPPKSGELIEGEYPLER